MPTRMLIAADEQPAQIAGPRGPATALRCPVAAPVKHCGGARACQPPAELINYDNRQGPRGHFTIRRRRSLAVTTDAEESQETSTA